MPVRKSNEEFLEEVRILEGTNYTFHQEYINNRTKLEVTHNVCGMTYKVSPKDFLAGVRCRECRIKESRISPEKYAEDFERIMGDEFSLLSRYVKGVEPITFKHNICGNVAVVRASNLYETIGCAKCVTAKQTKTLRQYKKDLEDIHGDNYAVLGEYVNNKTHIETLHRKCGRIFLGAPDRMLKGGGCTHCYTSKNKTHDEFVQEVQHRLDHYEILEKYKNRRSKMKVLHKECGSVWDVLPPDFIKGSECPHCTITSKGERALHKLLSDKGYRLEPQKTFGDLKYKALLSYDFYLPDLGILLEYQGVQHYKPYTFGSKSHEEFEEQFKRDSLKRDYAISNNYTLIEVPYYYSDEGSINKYLMNFNFYTNS